MTEVEVDAPSLKKRKTREKKKGRTQVHCLIFLLVLKLNFCLKECAHFQKKRSSDVESDEDLEFELAFSSSSASFDLGMKLTDDKFERCFVQDMVGKGMPSFNIKNYHA